MVREINILSASQSAILNSIQATERSIGDLQNQLATGKRVNSAFDNPQNFFAAKALNNRAGDLSRLLDGIGQSIRTVQLADSGLEALGRLVDQAEAVTDEARQSLLAQTSDLQNQILADEPVVYYRFDDPSTTAVTNLGTAAPALNGTKAGGAPVDGEALYFGSTGSSFTFDGINDQINIPNSALINTDNAGYPLRTVEMVFEAGNTNGRQVLYEEGGTGNAFSMYIDNGRLYVAARDAGDFGPFNISIEIEAGQAYHAAFVFDSGAGTFKGYLNGEEFGSGVVTKPMNRHGAQVAIGAKRGGTFYHDGASGGNGDRFTGRIGEFALYNDAITQEGLQARYDATGLAITEQYQDELQFIYDQIDPLVQDAQYRGINLLKGEEMTTFFNETRSNFLVTQGRDFTSLGLGLTSPNFQTQENLETTAGSIRGAKADVRQFGTTLATNLSIIQSREDFTRETINSLESGSDDLTVADQNELGAELLSQQVRQSLQFEALAFSARQLTIADFLL